MTSTVFCNILFIWEHGKVLRFNSRERKVLRSLKIGLYYNVQIFLLAEDIVRYKTFKTNFLFKRGFIIIFSKNNPSYSFSRFFV